MTRGVPHEPTDTSRAAIEALASCGIPREKIAAFVNLSVPTLNKYYIQELNRAEVEKIKNISNCLYAKALEGNVPSMIFFLKTRAGWRETDREDHKTVEQENVGKIQIEIIGKDKGTVQVK